METTEITDSEKNEEAINNPKFKDWFDPSIVLNSEDVTDVDVQEIVGKINIVRTAIREKHPESDIFVQDTIPCPLCKTGTVAFIISDHYNGHIHARCNTPDCINWCE
jgi:hypothetical protein